MKHIILKSITLCFMLATYAAFNNSFAQSGITIEASQVISNFKFEDSEGTKDSEYKAAYSGGYNIGYNYELDMGVFFNLGVGMRNGGATLVYDSSNYQWNFQYAQVRLTAGYVYDLGRIKPYIKVAGYYGYLLKAKQVINNQDFDIIDSESIEKGDIGLNFTPGARIDVSDAIAVYAEYSYLMGLKNIETSSNGQSTKNNASIFTLGLAFALQPLSK